MAEQSNKHRLTEAMLEELIKHVGGWIATLGQTGKPTNTRVPQNTRVDAAKTGINLVIKLMGQSGNYDGEKLLQDLDLLAREHTTYMESEAEDDEDDGPTTR